MSSVWFLDVNKMPVMLLEFDGFDVLPSLLFSVNIIANEALREKYTLN